MYQLEKRAMRTFVEPPSLWKRYVDDTFVKLKTARVEEFKDHLNSLHPKIQFTSENLNNNKIAFLDSEVVVKEYRTLKINIYQKPTHTKQIFVPIRRI